MSTPDPTLDSLGRMLALGIVEVAAKVGREEGRRAALEELAAQGHVVRCFDLDTRVNREAAASHLKLTSFDGAYVETLTLDQARRDDVLIAHTLAGEDMSSEHGGPVRLFVAPMYGYKSIKWLDRIEVADHLPDGGGYWEHRGYDIDAWTGRSNGGHQEPT